MTPQYPHKTTVRLSDENKENVDKHSEEHGSSMNKLVNIALDRLFRAMEEEKKPA